MRTTTIIGSIAATTLAFGAVGLLTAQAMVPAPASEHAALEPMRPVPATSDTDASDPAPTTEPDGTADAWAEHATQNGTATLTIPSDWSATDAGYATIDQLGACSWTNDLTLTDGTTELWYSDTTLPGGTYGATDWGVTQSVRLSDELTAAAWWYAVDGGSVTAQVTIVPTAAEGTEPTGSVDVDGGSLWYGSTPTTYASAAEAEAWLSSDEASALLGIVAGLDVIGSVGTLPDGVGCDDAGATEEPAVEEPVDEPADEPATDEPWTFVSESGALTMQLPAGWEVQTGGDSDCASCDIHTWETAFLDEHGTVVLELTEGSMLPEEWCMEPGYDGEGGFGPTVPMSDAWVLAGTAWYERGDGLWGAIAQVEPGGTDVVCAPYAGIDPAHPYSLRTPVEAHLWTTQDEAIAWSESAEATALLDVIASLEVTV